MTETTFCSGLGMTDLSGFPYVPMGKPQASFYNNTTKIQYQTHDFSCGGLDASPYHRHIPFLITSP